MCHIGWVLDLRVEEVLLRRGWRNEGIGVLLHVLHGDCGTGLVDRDKSWQIVLWLADVVVEDRSRRAANQTCTMSTFEKSRASREWEFLDQKDQVVKSDWR